MSSLSKEAKHSFRKAVLLEEHIGEVQIPSTESDVPSNMTIDGEGVDNSDIPERMQVTLSKLLLIMNMNISNVNHNVAI